MAKRSSGITTWLWYGAAAVVGYVILDKLGVIDQIRSQIGGIGATGAPVEAVADVARVNYSYAASDNSRRWLASQYPESMQARAYIGDAYGQGTGSMAGEYNTIPFALSS